MNQVCIMLKVTNYIAKYCNLHNKEDQQSQEERSGLSSQKDVVVSAFASRVHRWSLRKCRLGRAISVEVAVSGRTDSDMGALVDWATNSSKKQLSHLVSCRWIEGREWRENIAKGQGTRDWPFEWGIGVAKQSCTDGLQKNTEYNIKL